MRRPFHLARQGEDGATLIIALVTMVAMGILVASVLTYANTSARTVRNYRITRQQRYIGDAALKEAVNWASNKYNTCRDQSTGLGDPNAISIQTQVIDKTARTIKVGCQATDGSGSGLPTEVGQSMPEALLLLSDRDSEPGPYVARPCQGWWDSFLGFFTQNYTATVDASKGLIPEIGAWFRATTGLGTLNATCSTVSRAQGAFRVTGDIVAKTSLRVEADSITPSTNGGRPYAGNPGQCIGITCVNVAGQNRAGVPASLTASGETNLNGTNKATDPGRINPSSPSTNPVGDIRRSFRAVNFNSDGTPIIFDSTCTTASRFCERTTGYTWNSSTNVFTAQNTCPGTSPTIVFLPGWYRDANILSRYTTSAACKDVTFWFAPDPGPDGVLLTADDKTGAFYFDFRQGNAVACRGSANQRSQWCIGGSTDQNARIVVGTPKDWSPMGTYSPGGGSGPNRIAVTIDTANTVDRDLSGSWYDHNGNRNTDVVTSDARKIDGVAARYHPDNWGIGCIIWCFSTDRAIRLRNLSPDVTGPPIDEGAVTGDSTAAPRGRIYLTVVYSVTNPNDADVAQAVIEAVDPDSGRHSCGSYNLISPKSGADSATGLHTYTFTPVQARLLAAACGSVDLINGLEVKLQVTGNTDNSPRTNDWYLDGIRLNYDSFPSAQFPAPTNPSGPSSGDAAAKSDCEPNKAGGQFIFGGDSHVFVADGSVEICSGPYPAVSGDSVDNHVNTGLWQMASVGEIGPTGSGITCTNDCTSMSNSPAGVTKIDSNPITINYPGRCPNLPWTGTKTCDLDGTLNVPMNGYTPPSGYRIQRVTARVGYNPKNSFCTGLFGCPGNAPRLGTPSCSDQDYPKHSDQRMQIASGDIVTLYDDSTTGNPFKNCLNIPNGGGSIPSHTISWHARAKGVCVVYICGGANHDEFDGIAYQISLVPTDGSTPRLIPATGCLLVHPNYNSGFGLPDCALVKATTLQNSDNFSFPWSSKEGDWRGRFSVKGAIYAPSAPVEVDDTDVAYPLATRGAVLRHLRVTGFAFRSRYSGVAIDTTIDRTPNPREGTFTACIQLATNSSQYCGTGDQILGRARVLFKIDPTEPVPEYRAKIPDIQWWTDDK